MFDTIILGVDGQPSDDDVLRLARRLAAPQARLIATCVATLTHPQKYGKSSEAAAADVVTAVAEAHPDLLTEVMSSGSAAEGLHQAAERHGASLIVVGSCRHGVAGRIFAGNDAKATMHDSPCAVAIAPHGYCHADAPITKIGVGYDCTPQAEAALAAARALADEERASVEVLNVVEVSTAVGSFGYYTGSDIDGRVESARNLLDRIPDVRGSVSVGLVPDELEQFAVGNDLLVIGTRHHSTLGRVMAGSNADALVAHCPRPLLVVPAIPVLTTG